MAEQVGLVLTDPESVAQYRAALVGDFPNILEASGAGQYADLYRQGRHQEVVEWILSEVSTGIHGFKPGKFGIPAEQVHQLNPLAQRHGLIGPVRLWRPGDQMPEGAQPGDIAEYKVVAAPESLTPEALKANVFLGQGATHDGMLGRIDSILQAAAYSEIAKQGGMPEVVFLTGMRRTEPREGKSQLYLGTLPPDVDSSKPIESIFRSETDSALAILQSRCQQFELIDEIGDPDKAHKPADRIHPELGGRTWIARTYSAKLTEDQGGAEMLVTVVNGEPILTEQRLNAGKDPAPLAVEILRDWLSIVQSDSQLSIGLGVTYAHLARIGAELLAESRKNERGFGYIALLGSMPQESVWNRTEVDERTGRLVLNGASLVLGELLPSIMATNALLGRPKFDITA
jgi:hypothetical protein